MKNHVAIRAFFSYANRYKGAFWLTAAVFAMSDIVITAIPWFIGQLARSLTVHHGHIVLWTAVLILASVGHDMLWRTGEVLFLKLLTWRGHRFDDEIFAAVAQQPYSFFVDKFTGKISSYANMLGREFRELMDNFQYEYVNLIVALPIIAAIMFSVNIYTGIVFVVSLLIMFVVGQRLAYIAAMAERKETDEKSTIDGYVVDAIANFVSVKAFGNEHQESKRLFGKRHRLIRAAVASGWRDIWFWATMSFFVRWVIWPATLILNVSLYVHGRIGLPQITTFLAAIVQIGR